ncbi:MAG: hypothetical protein J6575_08175 [Bifidobacterium sp.]|nr:hypothetical protein [Bifidobacterium sp.]
MISEAIVKIVNKHDLTYDEAYHAMKEIMGGESTPTQNRSRAVQRRLRALRFGRRLVDWRRC